MTARLRVRLTPRAGADRVDGIADGLLRVRVSAAPVDGAANEALCRLLAREIGVPRTSVRVAAGATSRVKVVEIDGVEEEALRARWPGLA
jgi:uncharacterized protein YggU (UPF0235/DUF167 family)